MKKFLVIIVILVVWNSSAFANCRYHVTMKWGLKGETYVSFKFYNDSNKSIEIIEYGVLTQNEDLIAKYQISNKEQYLGKTKVIQGPYLSAYGRAEPTLNVVNKNTSLIHYAYYRCRYLK